VKIILSRKGWDSKSGGYASPITPCGRMLSLPIPVTPLRRNSGERGIAYSDLRFEGQPISDIIAQLAPDFDLEQEAHMDPDLDRQRVPRRLTGWRRTLGQQGLAQRLLKKVGRNDLFLFFGRFGRTALCDGRFQYCRRPEEDVHVVFGWLRVGEIVAARQHDVPQLLQQYPWLEHHPHIDNAGLYGEYNTIYIASDRLETGNCDRSLYMRGAGTCPCFAPSLQLTAPGRPMSHWCIPGWLKYGRSNHADWECTDNYIPFDSHEYGQCQEFIFDVLDEQAAEHWISTLFAKAPDGNHPAWLDPP
jgi:hypothetical protein